jgi:hypothetical protein
MKSALLWVIVILLIGIVALLGWMVLTTTSSPTPQTTFQTPTTTNQGGNNTNQNTGGDTTQPLSSRVSITSPKANTAVGKTFDVTGQAPGGWFFEATFPVQVRDASGNVIGRINAEAQGEWQTTELVPYIAHMIISGNYTGSATLILMRDNPSGLPENDDSVSIPIVIH